MTKSEINKLEESPTVDRCENVSDSKMPSHRSGLDDALQMAIEWQDEVWTAEEERKVLWKIDLAITPLVFHDSNPSCSLAWFCYTATNKMLLVVPWNNRRLRRQPGLWICGPFWPGQGPQLVY